MKSSKEFWIALSAVLILGAVVLIPLLIPHRPYEGVPRGQMEIKAIASALESYRSEFDMYPKGNAVEILKALQGDNPRKIILFETGPNAINVKGEFIDPWSTPYGIEVIGETNFVIQSAGPNCQFGDGDDYVFDGAKREFLKK